MQSISHKLIPSCLALSLIACAGASTDHASDIQASAMEVETGCASCIYEMEGVVGCEPAVRIEGRTYLVDLEDFDAHDAGLCDGKKTAVVSGEIEGDHYRAESFELVGHEGEHGHEAEHGEEHAEEHGRDGDH